MADFNLNHETFLTEDLSTCAFTTRGLAEVLGVSQTTLQRYFNDYKMNQNDPRKTLDEALALGLTPNQNQPKNTLYVFAEHCIKAAIHFAPRYTLALNFLALTSELGLVNYVAGLHKTQPNDTALRQALDALWQSERDRHRVVWKFFNASGGGAYQADLLMKAYYGYDCNGFRAVFDINPDAPDDWCPDHTTIDTLKELNDLRESFANTSKRKPLENRIQQAVLKTKRKYS